MREGRKRQDQPLVAARERNRKSVNEWCVRGKELLAKNSTITSCPHASVFLLLLCLKAKERRTCHAMQ